MPATNPQNTKRLEPKQSPPSSRITSAFPKLSNVIFMLRPLLLGISHIPRLLRLHVIHQLCTIENRVPEHSPLASIQSTAQIWMKEFGIYLRSCSGCTVELYSSKCLLIMPDILSVFVGLEIRFTAIIAPTAPTATRAAFLAATLMLTLGYETRLG